MSDLHPKIRLRHHVDPAPYIALSYCWGGPRSLTLTKSRAELDEWSVSQNDLPRTLLDAVRVTRELGVKYLWIDALCIVQDDNNDMAVEIGHMGDIYQNSYVTIMASRAKSVDEGFSHPRFPHGAEERSPGFRLPYQTKDGQLGSITAIEEDGSIAYVNPLMTRAWAFQEFLLSPRLLDYGQMCTTWICQDPNNPTDGFSSPPSSIWIRLRLNEFQHGRAISASFIPNDKSPDREELLNRVWTVIVQQYLRGTLTYPNDRFPALAGIAERVGTLLQDEYVAGGWRRSFWHSLVWHNRNGREWKRLPGYFAPSWSWASIPDAEIGFISTKHSFVDQGFQLRDFQVEPVNQSARYGALKSGSITISGRVLSATYKHHRDSAGPGANTDLVRIEGLEDHYVKSSSVAIYQDAITNEIQEGDIALLFLCVGWDYKRNKMSGLFLHNLEDGSYVRWGLFSIFMKLKEKAHEISADDTQSEEMDRFATWRAGIPVKTLTLI